MSKRGTKMPREPCCNDRTKTTKREIGRSKSERNPKSETRASKRVNTPDKAGLTMANGRMAKDRNLLVVCSEKAQRKRTRKRKIRKKDAFQLPRASAIFGIRILGFGLLSDFGLRASDLESRTLFTASSILTARISAARFRSSASSRPRRARAASRRS